MVIVKTTIINDYLDFYFHKNKRAILGDHLHIDNFLWFFSSKLLAKQHVRDSTNKKIL